MFAWIRKILNNPLGLGVLASLLATIIFEVLKLLYKALGALDFEFLQRWLTAISSFVRYPVPLGYLLILLVVFLWLFWFVRRKLDLWPFGRGDSSSILEVPNRPRIAFEIRCIGWKPPTNHDVEYPINRNSRLRFTLTQIQPAQNYTFYIRFWSQGRAPRWIGITNSVGTQYIAKNGDEVSLTETEDARPGIEINLIRLIRTRFPDFTDELAVIDQFRLRGDAANLQEVIVNVDLTQ